MATVKWLSGTTISVPFSGGGILGLPNNAVIGASGVDSGHTDMSVLCDVEGIFTFNTPPTLNTGISIWFLHTLDDTNWEFDSASGAFTPARSPDVILPLMSTTGQQRVTSTVIIPAGDFKPYVKNDGTGQTLATSGCDIRLKPLTYSIA